MLGVPVESRALKGLDSLLSIAQMPAGVPVGSLAIGEPGAKNAALLAISILALQDEVAARAVEKFRARRPRRCESKSCGQMNDRNRSFPAAWWAASAAASSGACLRWRRGAWAIACTPSTRRPDSPTGQISDREYNASFEDMETLLDFASGVDVVTYEFENIPVRALDALAPHAIFCGRAATCFTSRRTGAARRNFCTRTAFPSCRSGS